MTFNGSGNIAVKLYEGASTSPSSDTLIQTIHIDLPSGQFPIPNLATVGTGDGGIFPRLPANRAGGIFPGRRSRRFSRRLFGLSKYGTYYSSTGVNRIGAGAFFLNNPPNCPGTAYNFDVVRTVLPSHGDYRLVAGANDVPNTVFSKHPLYDNTSVMMASNLSSSNNPAAEPGNDVTGKYFSLMPWATGMDIPSSAPASLLPGLTGDFDTSLPNSLDGPYVNKPDEGNTYRATAGDPTLIPYFSNYNTFAAATATFFSPNRIMPSPGMFGSLSTGVVAQKPWQTLLFRPDSTGAH